MYYVEVVNYDDFTGEDKKFYAIVVADSMSEAVKTITDEWETSVLEITIREVRVDSSNIVYLPEKCTAEVLEENTF